MRYACVLATSVLACLISAFVPQSVRAADPVTPACPLTLESMQFTGITAAQTQRRYRVEVGSSSKGPLQLQLALVDSRSQVVARATTATFDPGSGRTVIEIWSPKPLAAVSIEGVTRTGAGTIACGSETSLVDADHADPTLTVFAHDRDLATGATVSVSVMVEARMLTRPQPDYPQFAVQQGTYGDVVVLVRVGPKGTAQDAIVYRTSDDASLDAAAVQAAKRASYSAPMRNGEPITADYLVVYLFRIQGMQANDPCGASIRGFHLTHAFDQLHGALFSILVASTDANISSADLGLYSSQTRNGVALVLPQIVFEKSDSSGLTPAAEFSKSARVLWVGPPVNYAALQSVVGLDGNSRPCHDNGVHALYDDGHLVVATDPKDADMASAHAWLILPARYDQREVPAYPVAESDAGHGGCAELLIHVQDNGSADRVEVIRSSGENRLDRTAIAAAMASRYRSTTRNGAAQTEYYSSTYCFSVR